MHRNLTLQEFSRQKVQEELKKTAKQIQTLKQQIDRNGDVLEDKKKQLKEKEEYVKSLENFQLF